ncbi:MAG: hypothetical protein K2Q03_03500 [Sphingobacteriaceae bacterium]|nr:hypothetical protein [Sphingobacteriaceae bacterium]
MYKICIALMALLWVGCRPCKNIINTVKVIDTVGIESVRVDTLIKLKQDTIKIKKDRLKLLIVKQHDTLRVNAECQGDTIYRVKYLRLPQHIEYVDKGGFAKWWWLLLAGAIISLIIIIKR